MNDGRGMITVSFITMIKNMKKAFSKIVTSLAMYLLPVVAFAQTETIADFGDRFFEVINGVLIPLIFALSFLWFLWNMFQYIFFQEDEKKDKARAGMIWGIIGLFIMFSIWGLVRLIVNTADLNSAAPTDTELPVIPTNR
jgi:hypothetical protein